MLILWSLPGLWALLFRIFLLVGFTLQSLATVSYTHLDVYKRQRKPLDNKYRQRPTHENPMCRV